MTELVPISPFRFWAQKVLPSVYDDSLSYYEVLCKVTDKLNEIIVSQNDVIDNFQEVSADFDILQGNFTTLENAFISLRNFVDNYFDTLDVQDEINNKLDEMASDGTLDTLFAPFIAEQIPLAVTDWLEEHLTPTTPTVDDTLSISGAAADSATVGSKFANSFLIHPVSDIPTSEVDGVTKPDLNKIYMPGWYILTTNIDMYNTPLTSTERRLLICYPATIGSESLRVQIIYYPTTKAVYIRGRSSGDVNYQNWTELGNSWKGQTISANTDINSIRTVGGYYELSASGSYSNAPWATGRRIILNYPHPTNTSYCVQIGINSEYGNLATRTYHDNQWDNWAYPFEDFIKNDTLAFVKRSLSDIPTTTIDEVELNDLDKAYKSGWYTLEAGTSVYGGATESTSRRLFLCYPATGDSTSARMQVLYYPASHSMYIRGKAAGATGAIESWKEIGNAWTGRTIDAETDIDNLRTVGGFYELTASGSYPNAPWDSGRRIIMVYPHPTNSVYCIQVGINSGTGSFATRTYHDNQWDNWAYPFEDFIKNDTLAFVKRSLSDIPTTTIDEVELNDLDKAYKSGWYTLEAGTSVYGGATESTSRRLFLCYPATGDSTSARMQVLYYPASHSMYIRGKAAGATGAIESWKEIGNAWTGRTIDAETDIDNLRTVGGFYELTASGSYPNAPWDSGRRIIMVYPHPTNSVYCIQVGINSGTGSFATRTYHDNQWDNWAYSNAKELSSNLGIFYSLFTPINSRRFIYGKGKMWEELWNTNEAYIAAAGDSNCFGIDGDVRYTADNKLIMYHPNTVIYNGVETQVGTLTLAQIQTVDLTDSKFPDKTYKIPTYDEFLDACKKGGKVCCVETKGPAPAWSWTLNGHTAELKALVDKIYDAGMQRSCMFLVSTSDQNYIIANYPDIPVQILSDNNITKAQIDASANNPQIICSGFPTSWNGAYDSEDVNSPTRIVKTHQNGRLGIVYWTRPQTAENIDTMISVGADAVVIFTEPNDFPATT